VTVTTYKQDLFGCLLKLFMIAVICFVIWELLPESLSDKLWYSFQYQVSMSQVNRAHKPTDCDWGFAPLGNKGCHYKKLVTGLNADGWLVAGQEAPMFSRDVAGNIISSVDDGKKWQPATQVKSLTVTRVVINWMKVSDE